MKQTAKTIVAIAAMSALAAGCTGANLKTDYTLAQERVNSYLAANPNLSAPVAQAIGRMELRKGMTKEQIIAAWGKPVYI